ncbi:MAG: tRNA-modifying protein YgfZ [Vibrio sp.]
MNNNEWNGAERFTAYPLTSSQPFPELAICTLPSWGAVTMIGDDKKSYLHGQVTCDVVALDANTSTLGAHCDAKGKMISTFRLFHHNDGYAMFQRLSAMEKELVEIKKYAIFSKVTIEASNEVFLGVIGSKASSFIEGLTGQAVADANRQVIAFDKGTAVQIESQRWLIMLTADQASALVADLDEDTVTADEGLWDLADALAGLPRLNAHEQLEHIPQAMNLQALDGISFKKGCYTGQETVARAKYRGINKRALFQLTGQLDASVANTPSAELKLERQVGDNWRSAGTFNSHYQYADGVFVGLAVLPNDLEADTLFRLTDYPEKELQFSALPYSLEDAE